MTKRLLINWVYYPPAGHVVEAIQHAHGYHAANPDLAISLLLSADARKALGLAEGCPWLADVYTVSLAELIRRSIDGYVSARVPAEDDPSLGIIALGRSGQPGLSTLHDDVVAREAAATSDNA